MDKPAPLSALVEQYIYHKVKSYEIVNIIANKMGIRDEEGYFERITRLLTSSHPTKNIKDEMDAEEISGIMSFEKEIESGECCAKDFHDTIEEE